MLHDKKRLPVFLLSLICLFGGIRVADAQMAARQLTPLNSVAAVVNDDVITGHELSDRVDSIKIQLEKQGIALPPQNVLERQVLERMILSLLQSQFAKETGVRVDDAQLDKTLLRIAQENKFASLEEFKAKLVADQVDFKALREEVRAQIVTARLREREVDSKLMVSDSEIENYLASQAGQMQQGEEFQLAHIMVVVPEQASAEQIQERRQKAEQAIAQLQAGADFAQVAAGTSDASDAMQGGNLGWRAADRIPPLFLDAIVNMSPGQVSPILRSPNGFHIVKLIDKRDKDSAVMVMQTRVSHILIKVSENVSDAEAKNRIEAIKRDLGNGAAFADLARRNSEDGSATSGGDLGWISPGDTVPEFEAAMNALEPGQVSEPVRTSFGWHLIEVTERRNADVSEEQRRQQARTAVRALKSDEAFEDWLRQLRDRAYVEYR
ncbi:MAG: peptidylprolyl isomerase [Gallionellaceae bacterium]|jgi:peptidyl-prolyl cis-trans isomerase SurA|nr:peptidylprolyl isomerase [Gallionellaceae bacterium]